VQKKLQSIAAPGGDGHNLIPRLDLEGLEVRGRIFPVEGENELA
jgi:hypothetical protein